MVASRKTAPHMAQPDRGSLMPLLRISHDPVRKISREH
jgi:hypothetical protein